jgi:hypothetical protein
MSCGLRADARTLLAAAFVAIACFGCASGASNRERLKSPNAYERATAAVRSAESGDAGAIHTLVDLLEDRDGGVRLYAIRALERMTGRTYEYQHFAPEAERDLAVERWREGLRRGEVTLDGGDSRRSQMAAETTPISFTAGDAGGGLR